mgnify:CR=1 FL=1
MNSQEKLEEIEKIEYVSNIKKQFLEGLINNLKLIKYLKQYGLTVQDCYDLIYNIKYCEYCHEKPAVFFNFTKGYGKYCSCACFQKQNGINLKGTKRPNKKRANLSEEVKKEIVRKGRETKLKKYGSSTYNNSEKANKTKEKNKKDIYKKVIETKIKNNTLSSVKKIKKTTRKKYGVDFYAQLKISNFENLNEKYIRENFIEKDFFLIKEFSNYFNISITAAYKYKKKFNITQKSKNIKDTKQYVLFKNINCKNKIYNDRIVLKPKEIDILLPDEKIAIEYQGLMFHSYGESDISKFNNPCFDYKDLNKFNKIKDLGYTYIGIYEGENIDFWVSFIHNITNINKYYNIKKYKITPINENIFIEFNNENNIEKFKKANNYIGLYENNMLVGVVSYNANTIIQFCNKLNYNNNAMLILLNEIKKTHPHVLIRIDKRIPYNFFKHKDFKVLEKTDPVKLYFDIGSHELHATKDNLKNPREFYTLGDYIYEF